MTIKPWNKPWNHRTIEPSNQKISNGSRIWSAASWCPAAKIWMRKTVAKKPVPILWFAVYDSHFLQNEAISSLCLVRESCYFIPQFCRFGPFRCSMHILLLYWYNTLSCVVQDAFSPLPSHTPDIARRCIGKTLHESCQRNINSIPE